MRLVPLALGALMLLLIGSGPAQAAFPGRNGDIVFTGSDGSDDECGAGPPPEVRAADDECEGVSTDALWRVRPSGKRLRMFSYPGDGNPAFSPDGRHVAADGIEIVGPGGRRLPLEGFEPAWSPDGTQIAFTRGSYVWTAAIDAPQAEWRRLAPGHSPAWSTRGEIAIVHRGTIEVVRPDGSGLRSVGRGYSPDWSPDGRAIVYSTSDWDAWNGVIGSHDPRIAVMAANGTARRQLVRGMWPVWSPDGRRIAYNGPPGSVFVMNRNGTGARELVTNVYFGTLDWQALQA